MVKKSGESVIAKFFKIYPKTAIAISAFAIYLIIRGIIYPTPLRWIGILAYLSIAFMLIKWNHKPGLRYHITSFEANRKDQTALLVFFLFYLLVVLYGKNSTINIIGIIVMIFILIKYLFKYFFIIVDIFTLPETERLMKRKKA